MDPVSQGSLGAALAGSAAGRRRLVAAAGVGALSGMAADLDVLIRSDSDPLLFLEYHRQFTHALLFAPVGALLCAFAAYLPMRRWLTAREIYVYCLLAGAPAGPVYDRLVTVQADLARGPDGTGKPMQCSARQLARLAAERPSDLSAMSRLLGERHAERFGPAFLDVLREE